MKTTKAVLLKQVKRERNRANRYRRVTLTLKKVVKALESSLESKRV